MNLLVRFEDESLQSEDIGRATPTDHRLSTVSTKVEKVWEAGVRARRAGNAKAEAGELTSAADAGIHRRGDSRTSALTIDQGSKGKVTEKVRKVLAMALSTQVHP